MSFLTLDQEQLKDWQSAISTFVTDYRSKALGRSSIRIGDSKELKQKLWEPLPQNSSSIFDIFELLSIVFDNISDLTHPRFFAFVPSPGNQVGSWADYLVSELNVFAGSWLEASGPAMIEEVVIDWFKQEIGLPKQSGGLFLSGGSIANLTALVTARTNKLGDNWFKGTVYFSNQTHSSIKRALKIIGFPSQQIRIIPIDKDYQISIADLEQAIVNDKKNGLVPFCIIGNAGTTNTGSIDPLDKLSQICQQHNIWLHVDGAYGLPAMFVDKTQFKGIEKADSISCDPHKWLFQNYSCAFLLVANQQTLLQTFSLNPEYLQDASASEGQLNFWDLGPELTRPFRALKLWMSIKAFGFSQFQKAIDHGCHLAQIFEQLVTATPDWEVITPAKNGICCFRFAPSGKTPVELDNLNHHIVHQMTSKGRSGILSTMLNGQIVLRICSINPRTTSDDMQLAMEELIACSKEIRNPS
jgi:glutamate/tyrosine decarboxylase-like PLP-dependent enzyme